MTGPSTLRRGLRSQRFRRGTRLLGVAVAAMVIIPFIIYAFPPLIGAEGSYVVLSGSMEPTLSPGDVIIVYSVAPEDVEAGDVITFSRSGDRRVTHRVQEVVKQDDGTLAYRTKGDANEEADQELVPAETLIGRVPALQVPFVGTVLVRFPLLGHVILGVNRSPVTFLLIVGAIIAIDELRRSRVGDTLTARFRVDPDDGTGDADEPAPAAADLDADTSDIDAGATADADPAGAEEAGTAIAGGHHERTPVATEDGATEDIDPAVPAADPPEEIPSAVSTDDPLTEGHSGEAAPSEVPAELSVGEPTADGATLTTSRTDLWLATTVLVALAAYSGVVALLGQAALALAVLFGATMTTGWLAVTLRRGGTTDEGQQDEHSGPEPVGTGAVVEGDLPADTRQLPVVAVRSTAELVERARQEDGWVVRRDGAAAYTDGSVLFVHEDDRAPAGSVADKAAGTAEATADGGAVAGATDGPPAGEQAGAATGGDDGGDD